MRLTLKCTGGFAGPAGAQTRTVDLAKLPPDQSSQLEQLLHASDFFTLPPKLVKEAPKSWDFQYDLEVDDGGKAQSRADVYGLDSLDEFAVHHPIGRILQPEEIASAVSWLCAAEQSGVTGISLPVDGGMTIA